MAEIAKSHGLKVETANFETWDATGRTFDLIVSGQAWHWINPTVGALKIFQLLNRGGLFAPFWNLICLDAEILTALESVYHTYAPELVEGSMILGGGQGNIDEHHQMLNETGLFKPCEQFEYTWFREYNKSQWVELMGTHSDHRILPIDGLERLQSAIGASIDGLGGVIRVQFRTVALFVYSR